MAEHETLAAALAAFQAELPKLKAGETAKVKTRTGGEYEYKYADLAEVTEVVSPVLGRHGLSFSARPTMVGTAFGLVYELRHEMGEMVEGFWPLPDPLQTPAQEIGSAITYGRRYCFLAVTNTFPSGGADDDGRAASERPEQPRQQRQERPARSQQRGQRQERPATATDDQRAVEDLGRQQKTWTDEEVRDQHAKLAGLELDKAVKLYDWMAGKTLHSRVLDYPEDAGGPQSGTEIFAVRLGDLAAAKGSTLADLDKIRGIADERGLLKVQVSETETLDEVLAGMRSLRNAERLETSQHAQDMRAAAGASWQDGE